jgi:hypothetical protein
MVSALTPLRCSPKSDGNVVNTVPTFGAIVFVVTSNPGFADVFDSISIESDLIHPANDLIRSFQARSRRKLADEDKIPDVLLRDEAGGHSKHLETCQSDKSEVDQKNYSGHSNKAASQIAVAFRQPIKCLVEDIEKWTKE